MKLYSEMDAGEQREFLARKIAFGSVSYEWLNTRIKVLAKRVRSTPEKVRREIYKDARIIAGT